MTPLPLVLMGVGLMGLGAGSALLLAPRPRLADPVFCTMVVAGLCAVGVSAWQVLRTGDAATVTLLPVVPAGPWTVGLDPLSAWFLLVLSVVGAAATTFGIRFLAADRDCRPVAATHALLALLHAAMVLVLLAVLFSSLVRR